MSEYFYGAGRKVALHRKPVVARLPERRGISTIGRIVKLLVGQGHGFIRMLNVIDKPLCTLNEAETRPPREALDKIMRELM